MSLRSRLKAAFNVFRNAGEVYDSVGTGSYYRKDRHIMTYGNSHTIVTSVYNRIALDVAALKFRHVQLDVDGRFSKELTTELNNCLSLMANVDQTARSFIQDIVLSCIDEGCVAVVPVDTTADPRLTDSYDIGSLRVGRIVQWYPQDVRVQLYNDQNGEKNEVVLPKSCVAIIDNPFYSVMNAPNSTLQRLLRKLTILDELDDQVSSNKLNMIIQLPYAIKSQLKLEQAEKRREDLENQLVNSKYGIAYIDGTEKVTQLNRSLDNNLLDQIEYLTTQFYAQLGITQEIMNGTADEKVMLNYTNRIVEPFAAAISTAFTDTFISKTGRTQGKWVTYFTDPFRLVPVSNIAEIADKFTRNEIMTSNEIRQIIGLKPSDDPSADELRNKNLNQSADTLNAEEKQALAAVNDGEDIETTQKGEDSNE